MTGITVNVGSVQRVQRALSLSRRLGASVSVFDGAAAAYSLRIPQGSTYSGPLIRVRRSSDNAEQDIGAVLVADANGNRGLDTTALLAFCGAGSGFVTTWYDQSSNQRHVTQSASTSQPRIVNAGALEQINTRPTIFFDGVNDILARNGAFLYAAGSTTASSVLAGAPQADKRIVAEGSSTAASQIYSPMQTAATVVADSGAFIRNDGVFVSFSSNVSLAVNAFDGSARVLTHTDTGSTIASFLNGTAGNWAAYTRIGVLTLDRFAVGGLQRSGPASLFAGRISECVLFPAALIPADRQALERSQGAAFGITVA